MPSQSYMWFNGTGPYGLGQYCGGIYKLLCVCVCMGRCAGGDCDRAAYVFDIHYKPGSFIYLLSIILAYYYTN